MKDGTYEIVTKTIGPDGRQHDGMTVGSFQLIRGKITHATPTLMRMGKIPPLSELLRQYSNLAYYEIKPA